MTNRRCVFLFPGQGSQTVGMGMSLLENFPELNAVYEEASDALGLNMKRLCFEDPDAQLGLTEFTQPALLTCSTAAARALEKRFEIRPSAVAGHSLGEYSALVQAKALGFSDALRAVRFRGQAMQRAVPVGVGAMAAYVGSQVEKVQVMCAELSTTPGAGAVEIVNFNSRSQLVLSGHKTAVDAACARISSEKWGRAIPLNVSAPFHSSLMKPAAEEMAGHLESVPLNALAQPLFANVDARKYKDKEYTKDLLVQQVASAVLWTQTLDNVQKEMGEGVTWIELGSGTVLQGLLKKTLEGQTAHGTQDFEAFKSLLEVMSHG